MQYPLAGWQSADVGVDLHSPRVLTGGERTRQLKLHKTVVGAGSRRRPQAERAGRSVMNRCGIPQRMPPAGGR